MPRQKLKWYDDPVELGRRLRAAREAAGLSQRDLATVGCTAAYVSRIEKGERVPSLQLLRHLALRLGITEHYLAYGSEAAEREQAFSVTEPRVALRLGEIATARELAGVALSQGRNDSERALALGLLGQVALAANDYRQAIELLEQARQLHAGIELADPDAADALGRAYSRASEFESAIAVFTRVRDAAVALGDTLNEVRFATLLAGAQSACGNVVAAEEAVAQALRAGEGLEDPLSRARTLWVRSRRIAQNDPAAAAIDAERALAILQVHDYAYHAALAHQLLAHIELARGNGERAAELLEEAEPLIEASGRPVARASFQVERARVLLAIGRREDAAATAAAASAAVAADVSADAARSLLAIADVFRELGEPGRAIELYELAIEQLRPTPDRHLVEAYTKLAELFEERGMQQRALELLKAAMQVQADASRFGASNRDVPPQP